MKANRKPKSSLAQRNIQKFMQNKLALLGLFIFALLLICVIAAPLLTDKDPSKLDPFLKYAPPSAEHPLGCDSAGRDVWARLLYGGRTSIFIGLAGALSAGFIGVALGCISGYFGKRVDFVLQYIAEIVSSFPSTMLIMILVGFVGRGVKNLILIFALTGWTGIYPITRLRILSLREETFVQSLRANGISRFSIMFRHLLPNTLGIIVGSIAMNTGGCVLSEAGLSFLGLGVPIEVATWGNMLNSAQDLKVFISHPLLWIVPGLAVSLFVLSVNFFGSGLRDVLDARN